MKIGSLFGIGTAAFALVWIGAAAGIAAAQTPTLSLAQALQIAREHNPLIDIAHQRIDVAQGMRTQAGLIPNPVLTATSENEPLGGAPGFTFSNQTDDYIYASQTIELGGKRQRRVAAAQAGIAVSGLEAEIALRQLAARVALAYWGASAAAMVRELYREEAATLSRMVAYSRARVHEGAAAGADLLRIQLESDRLAASANLAAAEADRTLVGLYQEMGAGDFPQSVTFTDSLQAIAALKLPSLDVVLRQRPEVRLANARLQQAQATARLERANAIPDPDLMLGYKRWSGYDQFVGRDTLFFGVKAALPLFNRNQGRIAAADAELRIAKLGVKAQELAIRAEVASALKQYRRSLEALERIMPAMNERASRNLEITREAYHIGGADLIRFLDAERMRIETRVSYLRALAQYHQSLVHLEYATGMTIR